MMTPLRVLILETDPSCAESIAARLRETGLAPNWRRVDSEQEYLDALDPPPDLILADNTSPRFSAHHARKRLQEHGLDVPFLALSSTNGDKTASKASANGHRANCQLSKAAQWRLGKAVSRALEEMERTYRRQAAERGARQSDDWFRTLLESTGDGVSVVEADGSIRYASPAGASLLGYTPEELVGTSALDLLHPDELGRLSKRFLSLLRRPGASITSVHRARHKDGSWLWLESSGRNRLGEVPVSGIVHTFRDVTARVQAEHALRQAKEAAEAASQYRSEFLSSLGHDLRTPLNAIIGFTSIMLMNLSGPLTEAQAKHLRTVERSANILLAMINDLLRWNKVESASPGVRPEWVVCQEVVGEIVRNLEITAAGRGLLIAADLPAKDLALWADRRLLADVLQNLLEHAIEMTNDGEIQVKLERRMTAGATSACFGITLGGTSLSANELADLQGVLGQGDVLKHRPSAGLWLTLNRRLARRLGGDLCFSCGECGTPTLTLTVPEHTDGYHPGG